VLYSQGEKKHKSHSAGFTIPVRKISSKENNPSPYLQGKTNNSDIPMVFSDFTE
jgi:hypothetical protein